jgi:hypothetical protein
MTDFEFNCKTLTNRIMAYASCQHHLAVEEARDRQAYRAAARVYRKVRSEKRLNTALLVASMIGIAVATWFLASVGAS